MDYDSIRLPDRRLMEAILRVRERLAVRVAVPDSLNYRDEVYGGGFGGSCHATRARRSSLIVPGGLPVTERVAGDALSVLHTVVSDWTPEYQRTRRKAR